MKKLKRILRLLMLVSVIIMASIIPVPMQFYNKDNLPKDFIELIETNDDENEEDDIKEIT